MANQDSYALNPVTENTVILGFESDNPKRTRNYLASEVGEYTVWGTIQGNLSDQTDLYDYLTGLQDEIDNLPPQFNPIAGTGIDITGTYPNMTFNATGGGDNIANADLTFDATHTVDMNGHRWGIFGGSEIDMQTSLSPSPGAASFEFTGFGSGFSDYTHILSTGAGDAYIQYGNLDKEFFGKTYFDNTVGVGVAPVSNRKIYAQASGTDDAIYAISQNGTAGYFYSSNYRGIEVLGGQYAGIFQNTSGALCYIGSSNYGAFGQGSSYGLYGDSASGTGVCASSASGLSLEATSRVKFSGLPTSSAGLATGELWNDSGTIKIV